MGEAKSDVQKFVDGCISMGRSLGFSEVDVCDEFLRRVGKTSTGRKRNGIKEKKIVALRKQDKDYQHIMKELNVSYGYVASVATKHDLGISKDSKAGEEKIVALRKQGKDYQYIMKKLNVSCNRVTYVSLKNGLGARSMGRGVVGKDDNETSEINFPNEGRPCQMHEINMICSGGYDDIELSNMLSRSPQEISKIRRENL